MASQIGVTRVYSSEDEATSVAKRQCPKCKVNSVPRSVTSTRRTAEGEKHCLNCGHVYGRII